MYVVAILAEKARKSDILGPYPSREQAETVAGELGPHLAEDVRVFELRSGGFIDYLRERGILGCVTHAAVAGMMVVDSEDVDTVARMRRGRGESPVTCEDCDGVYDIERGWVVPA